MIRRVHLAGPRALLTACGLIAARVNARPRWSTPLPATPRPWRCARCMRVLRWRDRRTVPLR
jgi:hypothetical protein